MTTEATLSDSHHVTEDAFLGGRMRLRQFSRGHRAGHDAVLLAAATPATAASRVVEFGAGTGAAGLALASRIPGIGLTMVEIDRALAGLARDNAALNGVAAQVLELDVGAPAAAFEAAGLPPDSADVILMNPPFHGANRHRASPDAGRQMAHIDPGTTLDIWTHAARRLLVSGGVLSMIWRADGLGEVTAALSRGFGGLEIVPVYPRPASPAIRILVRAAKASRAPLRLLEGIVLNDESGQPTQEAEAVLGGTAAIAGE